MEINITYKSPEHEAAFLSELQRIPHIINPESGRVNPYWARPCTCSPRSRAGRSSALPLSARTT